VENFNVLESVAMKNFLRSLARAFWWSSEEKELPRAQITNTRIECEDCGHRTMMTVHGTCAVCGGQSFENSARSVRGKLEKLQQLRERKFPTKTDV
jgi:ribosomal protein L37E